MLLIANIMKNAPHRTQNANNDNEPLTFQTLAAVTASLTTRLQKNENADGEANGTPEQQQKEKAEDQRHYVDQRLKELRAFEERARGRR